MKIFLIGMPGAGKSTLGKMLAEAIAYNFVDLDHEIEKKEQRPIVEIFNHPGEEYFRLVESKMLQRYATSPDSLVIATGGGAPVFHKGIDVINKNGVSIFMDASIETLVKRTAKHSHRPLLANDNLNELRDKLKNILESRLPIYRKATITLHDATLDSTLQALKANGFI